MDDYLPKPFTSQQLYQALLAAGPAHRPPPGKPEPRPVGTALPRPGRDAVREMAGDFLNELPDRLKEIRRLHAAGQWTELKRAAHSLKGLFALFGFRALSGVFQTIEEAAGAEDARRVGAALEGFEAHAGRATALLRDWRQKQAAAA